MPVTTPVLKWALSRRIATVGPCAKGLRIHVGVLEPAFPHHPAEAVGPFSVSARDGDGAREPLRFLQFGTLSCLGRFGPRNTLRMFNFAAGFDRFRFFGSWGPSNAWGALSSMSSGRGLSQMRPPIGVDFTGFYILDHPFCSAFALADVLPSQFQFSRKRCRFDLPGIVDCK